MVAALAPAMFFAAVGLLGPDWRSDEVVSFLTVWALRDLVIALLIGVPVLAVAQKAGVKSPAVFWCVAVIIACPMGFVLANPAAFAWSLSEEDFQHGAYWDRMVSYVVLFGLMGLVFGKGCQKGVESEV